VGGLWAVQPGNTAIKSNERKQCALCETCKPASSVAFRYVADYRSGDVVQLVRTLPYSDKGFREFVA
jgi:hypothetical protein